MENKKFDGIDWRELYDQFKLPCEWNEDAALQRLREHLWNEYDTAPVVREFIQALIPNKAESIRPIFQALLEMENEDDFLLYVRILLPAMWA